MPSCAVPSTKQYRTIADFYILTVSRPANGRGFVKFTKAAARLSVRPAAEKIFSKNIRTGLDFSGGFGYNNLRSLMAMLIAGLCNGSTTDSDSVCLGSNPCPAATERPSLLRWSFLFSTETSGRIRAILTIWRLEIRQTTGYNSIREKIKLCSTFQEALWLETI